MNCPYCDNQESKVVDSRYIQDGIRRRRECLMCSLRFTTYEKIHSQLLNVTKRSNTKESFSVEKLTKSISTACKKRPRFSSVYRDFQNEDSFVDEIDKLKTENILNSKDQMEMFPQKKNYKKRKGVNLDGTNK